MAKFGLSSTARVMADVVERGVAGGDPDAARASHAHGSSSLAAMARALGDFASSSASSHVVPSLDGAPHDDPGPQAQRLRVVGVGADGAVDQRQRFPAGLVREPRAQEEGADRALPGVEALRRLAARPGMLGGEQLRPDAADDARRDLVLDGEDIVEVAVVAVAPEMAAGGRVDELGGDADAVARLAHAPLEHVAHAKLAADARARPPACPCR